METYESIIKKKYEALKQEIESAKLNWEDNPEAQRDFAVALTHLDTAKMWAIKGCHERLES